MGLLAVLGLVAPKAGGQPAPGGGAGSKPSKEAALATWRSVRAGVIATLKILAAEAAAEKDSESTKAVLETQAVIKNLSADPDTAQEVEELKHWLADDDVVSDVHIPNWCVEKSSWRAMVIAKSPFSSSTSRQFTKSRSSRRNA